MSAGQPNFAIWQPKTCLGSSVCTILKKLISDPVLVTKVRISRVFHGKTPYGSNNHLSGEMRPLNWQITLHFMEAYLIFILVYILFIYNKEWETCNDSVQLTYWIHLLRLVDQKTINVILGLTNKQGLNFPGLKHPNHLDKCF